MEIKGTPNDLRITRVHSRAGDLRLTWKVRCLIAMRRGVSLQQLRASPMPVHVAKAAHIHQDVELQTICRGKGTRQFIVCSAVLGSQTDQFDDALFAEASRPLHAPGGIDSVYAGTAETLPDRSPA